MNLTQIRIFDKLRYDFIFIFSGTPRQLVDVYLNDGMTHEALNGAESLGDVNLRNKCHIVDSIIRLSDTRDGDDMDNASKEEICNKLEKVFFAMQDSKEKVLAGKAKFIVGKLNKDIKTIRKAYGTFEHCKPFSNIAGELEGMDWMTFNADLRNSKNLYDCILGMNTLFKALNMLERPINDSERTQLADMLEYYGFHRSFNKEMFRIYPRQKEFAATFIHKQNRHICDVKLLDACKWIFQFLARKGLAWKEKLEYELKCMLEGFLKISLDALKGRVEIGIRCIELEMHIRAGCIELEKRGSFFDKELGSLKATSFANCERIFQDIFNDNGTISFSTLDWKQMRMFCTFLKNPGTILFHQSMRDYLQYLVKHRFPSWKKNYVQKFLCFLFVYDIFGERLQIRPADVLKDIEDIAQTEKHIATLQENVKKWGFEVKVEVEKEQVIPVSSLCARMCDCQGLLKDLKPIAALKEFGNFCETLSQWDLDLLPCISPLLYWMEFYLTLFLFSSTVRLTKPNENNPHKIFLPMAYFRNTIAISCAFTNRTNIIQYIVKSSREASKQHDLQELLNFLQSIGKLLFGSSAKLNLFDVVFSYEENKIIKTQKNAFSERLLVLCLAVFCNLRKKVDKAAEIEKELAEKIWSLVSSQKQKNIPEEMKKIMKTKKHHMEPSDFQLMFCNFVNCRQNDENLFCFQVKCSSEDVTIHEEKFDLKKCRRIHFLNPETNQVVQNELTQNNKDRLNERISDKQNKPLNIHIDLSELNGKSESKNTLRVENHCTETEKTLVKQQNPQSREEKAIYTIVRALRKYVFRKKSVGMISELKQLIIAKKDEEIKKLFSSQSHDQTMCGVCGIHYVTSPDVSNDNTIIYERQENRLKDALFSHSCERLPDLESTIKTLNDSQADSCSSDSIDPFRLLMKRSQNIEHVQETYEAHTANEAHHSRLSQYESFRCKVNAEIYDAVNDVERFIDIYGLRNDDAAKLYPDLYPNIELLCNNLKELVELKKQIITEKDWGNTEIDDKVRDLLIMLSLLKEPVKQKAIRNKEVKFTYILTKQIYLTVTFSDLLTISH